MEKEQQIQKIIDMINKEIDTITKNLNKSCKEQITESSDFSHGLQAGRQLEQQNTLDVLINLGRKIKINLGKK